MTEAQTGTPSRFSDQEADGRHAQAGTGTRARIVRLDELTHRDRRNWAALAERAIEPNPFYEPTFVVPAVQRFGARDVALLVVGGVDRWSACLPVRRAWHWRRLPLRALVGWRHQYCFLGTPLIDDEDMEAVLALLVERALDDRRAGCLVLDWLGCDGPVASALSRVVVDRGLRSRVYESFSRAAIERRSEPTYLSETLRPKRRKELKRLERRLAEDLDTPLTVADRGDNPAAVAEFARLEAAGWKGREGTALASRSPDADFFEEACRGFRQEGRLQLLSLSAGERAVAMQCNLRSGEGLFCFKVAYDEVLASYSPGVQLELRAIDVFHARSTIAWMDSCAEPQNELINRLWPDRRALRSLVIAPKGAAGRSALASVGAAAALRARWRGSRAG